jgi:hypothetical protein
MVNVRALCSVLRHVKMVNVRALGSVWSHVKMVNVRALGSVLSHNKMVNVNKQTSTFQLNCWKMRKYASDKSRHLSRAFHYQ